MSRELPAMAVRGRKQCVAMRAQAQQQELDLVDEYTGLPIASASALNPEAA
jgi:hypothetical protein